MFSADITGQIHASPVNLHVCVITSLYFNNNISFPLQKIDFLGDSGKNLHPCLLKQKRKRKKGGALTHYITCIKEVERKCEYISIYLQAALSEMWSLLNNFGFHHVKQLKVNQYLKLSGNNNNWNALNLFISFKVVRSEIFRQRTSA